VSRVGTVQIAAAAALLMSHRDPETCEVTYREVEPIDTHPVFIRREARSPEPRLLRTTPVYERREPTTDAARERVRLAEARRARKLERQAKGFAPVSGRSEAMSPQTVNPEPGMNK
jgi:hypothetical protein